VLITKATIPLIEKALDIKLYDGQRKYLLYDGPYWFGDRRSGKTLAYCVKLALSDGEPLNMKKPWEICDNDYGPPRNRQRYSGWFRGFFLKIWHSLKDTGLPVREIIT
jgi:hypothetical protein